VKKLLILVLMLSLMLVPALTMADPELKAIIHIVCEDGTEYTRPLTPGTDPLGPGQSGNSDKEGGECKAQGH